MKKDPDNLRPGERLLTARDIIALLEVKHAEDVFVPECKDGPTHDAEHLRFDAWAMRKSWANPLVTGYEVKVTRADFLRDTKWHAYLPYCNEFYFVCPSGVIQPQELPPEVGLMVVATTGSRLFTKRRAQYRDLVIPESLYRYILMCRVRVRKKHDFEPVETNADFWHRWATDRKYNKDFGHRCGKGIAKVVREKIMEVEAENRNLKEQIEGLREVEAISKRLNLSLGYIAGLEDQVKDRLQRLHTALPSDLARTLKWTGEQIQRSIKSIDEFEKEVAGKEAEGTVANA